jgi:hypothetical protein
MSYKYLLAPWRATFVFALLLAALAGASPGLAAEAMRAEVGKPLQAAQDLLKTKKYNEALAKVREADAVSNKTPNESYTIERMRAAIATAAGDTGAAIKSYEAIIASGRLPAAEQLKMIQAVAGMHYQAKDFSKAVTWASRYLKEGGTDPQVRTLLVQAYYLNNDCTNVTKLLHLDSQAAEAAGRTPAEDQLQLMATCYAKQKDDAGYAGAIEKLLTYYPKKDYWVDLISRVQRKPGFADRLLLDVYRLKLASGNLNTAPDYMEMTQLALGDDFTGEAKKIVERGFSSNVLGTGTDAERQKRLRDLAAKRAIEGQTTLAQSEAEATGARDGTALVNLGFNYVGYGQFDKGIALMEQGIRKGGLKRPEDDKLHLGIAYVLAGQNAKAVQMFKTVKGSDGTADLARLWAIQARRPTT